MMKKFKSALTYALILVSVLCLISISSERSQALNSNKEDIFLFLKNNMGLNTAAACGVLANIEKESSFNPHCTGDSGTSYGICQWHNKRWDSLKDFCNTNGYDWTTLTGQLYYLRYELETSYYRHIIEYLRNVENTVQGAYDAAYYFCYHFEIPANRAASSDKRGLSAQQNYWPSYGYTEGYTASKLVLNSEFTAVSSRNTFSFSWDKPQGEFDRYILTVLKCIDGTACYDWSSVSRYELAPSKVKGTFPKASFSAGNYLAYIYPFNKATNSRGDYSNFVYFSVFDEMIYECESPSDGAVYDASAAKEVSVNGWAVNTGKKKVKFFYELDGEEKLPLTATEREDIYSQYSVYCTSNKIGYSCKLPTEDLSNGKHTLIIYAESETLSGPLSQITFTVTNSHDHSFTKYVNDNNASYSADGTKTAKCDYCSKTKTVTVTGTKLVLGKTTTISASDETSSSLTLNWKKVTGATGYRIYVYENNSWRAVKAVTTNSSKISGLKAGNKYTLAVKAYVKENGNTIWAPSYTQYTVTAKPTKTTKIVSTPATNTINLEWAKCNGATGYRLYYKTSGGWKQINTITTNSYKVRGVKPGTEYTFAVKAYIKTADKVLWADTYTTLLTSTKPATPKAKVSSPSKGKLTVAWSDVSGETGYQVWYSTKANSGYKKLSNYKANTTSVSKSGVTSGKTYYFKVRAYKKVGDGYIYSDPTSAMVLKIK